MLAMPSSSVGEEEEEEEAAEHPGGRSIPPASCLAMPLTWRIPSRVVMVSFACVDKDNYQPSSHSNLNLIPTHHDAVGPNDEDAKLMLESIGFDSLESLVKSTIPSNILSPRPLDLQPPMSESEALSTIRAMADKNRVMKSYIGMGYYDTIVPGVILRNVLFAATTPASP